MAGSFVLVFPGQGAQKVGMGRDLVERIPEVGAMFAEADRILGFPISRTIFEGPEEDLVDTAIQQPALVLVGLAMKKAIEIQGGRALRPLAAAGLSLGEYAALVAVGALSFQDALLLVRRRGELMKEAAQKVPGGMAVILHLDAAKVVQACVEARQDCGGIVAPCNFNGGGQIVIGGQKGTLERAMELCKAAGAKRVMLLPVSGAFHTQIMKPAAEGMREILARTPFVKGCAPVFANATAKPVEEPRDIRESLEKQLISPVLWEASVKNMIAAGHRHFLELGPGQSLSSLIRRIDPKVKTDSVGSWGDLERFLKGA